MEISMKIAIIGIGYVGLVTGVCLADFGNNIICVDNDKEKIDILNKGQLPIYEPGLKEIIERNRHYNYKRIEFTNDIKYAVENSEVIFITVGTPEKEDSNADLKYVFEVTKDIACHMNNYKVIVDKSTVPIGTGKNKRNKRKAKKKLKHLEGIIFYKDEYEAIEGADALVIITEWNQFRRLDFAKIKKIMKDNYIFDLRNIYSKEIVEKENGFKYFSVGR